MAKDRQSLVSGLRACEALAHGAVVQKLCNGGQRAQVGLKLIFGHNEKNDEFHRSIIERIKLDASCRSPERGDDFIEPVGRTIQNRHPESNSCAHGFVELPTDCKYGHSILWLN